MLAKFKVSNFKSFNKEITLDFTKVNGYNFNKECIKNNLINNSIVYGPNGVGKSNLGLAIFDIIINLTNGNTDEEQYYFYQNAYNKTEVTPFYYEFIFEENVVIYEYKKKEFNKFISERLIINGTEVVFFERGKEQQAIINLSGAETLKTKDLNDKISILKYILNNSLLTEENKINKLYKLFMEFVSKMLFFRSLSESMFIGLEKREKKHTIVDIIENNNVPDFEQFLNLAGIDCRLSVIEVEEINERRLVMDFEGTLLPFEAIASQGTWALTIFYYWLQQLRVKDSISFLFIDEFDAFYHHKLSSYIVNKLKETNVQFILTTHNTSIMNNSLLRPDCYFVMSKDCIRPLTELTDKELREAHNLEKMYKGGSFNVE
ncbi:ATP-binding protein [Myroides odoratimimus]|uniref:AAA family ATPase n=1 Tax=Myroides odoratimimus TaxID=76832 RepID=UPI0025764016|nr:ATP-binding protein [Myroides odoratimimus]MDM1496046.1 ATP-binding protein [Myroides odoratimimus]